MTARHTYRGLFALLAVLFGVLLAATAAYGASAYGSRPPEMKINYKGVTLQKPKTIGYRWFYAEDGRYRIIEKNWTYAEPDLFAAVPLTYPAVDRVPAGEKLRLRISHPVRPDAFRVPFKIRDYRTAQSKGEGQWVTPKFVAVKRGGQSVVQDVYFKLEGKRPHYLRIYAGWKSDHGPSYPGLVSYGSVWRTAYLKTY